MGKCVFVMHSQSWVLHSRYANLKEVVLNKLLAKHGDAQLDAQLHQAACMCTLEEEQECNGLIKATRKNTAVTSTSIWSVQPPKDSWFVKVREQHEVYLGKQSNFHFTCSWDSLLCFYQPKGSIQLSVPFSLNPLFSFLNLHILDSSPWLFFHTSNPYPLRHKWRCLTAEVDILKH